MRAGMYALQVSMHGCTRTYANARLSPFHIHKRAGSGTSDSGSGSSSSSTVVVVILE